MSIFCEGTVVISTIDETVLGSAAPGADESEYPLRPYDNEQFDTKVMLHADNAVSHGYHYYSIIVNDTQIIVLGYRYSVILALAHCGFHSERNYETFKCMTIFAQLFRNCFSIRRRS